METAALSLDSQSRADAAGREAHALLGLSAPAYRLAMRILGSPESAEDVVQGAYVVALERLRSLSPPLEMQTWFLGVVANLARLHRRKRGRRREKEAAMRPDHQDASGHGTSLAVALGGAMAMLDEKYRLPVSLCYEEGLTQRQAAAVLKVPERTLSRHVSTGLAKLRKALESAGYAVLPAAVLGGLKSTAPAVPASLAGQVKALVTQGTVKTGTGAAASVSAAAKGGIAMKAIAGVILAGAVAAGVAVSMKGGSEPLPAEAPKKFSTPVTAPGAVWELDRECWAGFKHWTTGYLDGPRKEAMSYAGDSLHPDGFFEDGAEWVFRAYDPETERFYTAAGGAGGDLDGPFGRARFAGWGYAAGASTMTQDGRFVYVVCLPGGKHKSSVKRLDTEKRVVTTVHRAVGWSPPIPACGPDGTVYVYDGSKVHVYPVEGAKRVIDLERACKTRGAAYDPKHDRLYGANRATTKDWTIFYWDLKTGKFHGVLPSPDNPINEGKVRAQMATGTFKHTKLWCPGGLSFGPDDPDCRYIYVGGGDENCMYRFDLEKETFLKTVPVAKDSAQFGFGESGGRVRPPKGWYGTGGIWWRRAHWDQDKDTMYGPYRGFCQRMRRVK